MEIVAVLDPDIPGAPVEDKRIVGIRVEVEDKRIVEVDKVKKLAVAGGILGMVVVGMRMGRQVVHHNPDASGKTVGVDCAEVGCV